jgi:hypothetical protein
VVQISRHSATPTSGVGGASVASSRGASRPPSYAASVASDPPVDTGNDGDDVVDDVATGGARQIHASALHNHGACRSSKRVVGPADFQAIREIGQGAFGKVWYRKS